MRHSQIVVVFATAFLMLFSTFSSAQVTTATLVGQVRDTSGAVIPGASVVATHQGTGVSREGVTDANGEFVFSALPNGPYAVRVELSGFRTLQNPGMQLSAGQIVRQVFTLQVGDLVETVTVAGEAPLIDTAASLQANTVGSQEVRELPVNRRNIFNLMSLTSGVSTGGGGGAGGGSVQMNGVAGGGTGITVDGTEANSNPEGRSLSQLGGQNQISVMGLDSIQEVQIVKGVLPAEYGGVAGGQINMISRSGTNNFHGTGFLSSQNEKWNARSFFSTAQQQPNGTFNQFGGTLGGPVLHNKAFFFTAYEGYRENVDLNLSATVPYQAIRNEILSALPFPETKIVLDTLHLPTEPLLSAGGVVNSQVGLWRGVGTRKRTENHVVAKVDLSVINGANLGVTYTRLRPFTDIPRAFVNNANNQIFRGEQDRIAALLVMTRGVWVSETRFGWNKSDMTRGDAFLDTIGPNTPPEVIPWGRRVGLITVSGLFVTPSAEALIITGRTYSFEQKFSRAFQRHVVKTGFRYIRDVGTKINPQNLGFTYQTYGDFLANIPVSLNSSFGAPLYDAKMSQYSAFVQDDWRLGTGLVLNLGLRYDYYGIAKVHPATDLDVEVVNLAPPTDLRRMDFGPIVDPNNYYEPDGNNVGPRVGLAWTLDENQRTVIRGGVGFLFSPHNSSTVRQGAASPYLPFRIIWNRTETEARGGKWPMYSDDTAQIVLRDGNGQKALFSIIDTHLPVPYTIQSMASVQRALGRTMAAEVGLVRTDGRNFTLHRQFTQAVDRQTGVRPNPALGAPGGYYVTSGQTMLYHGLQTSLQKRFSNRHSWEVNYTLGKSESTQGGDISAYYGGQYLGVNQDFWDPDLDYGPSANDVRHRFNASLIYELPNVRGGQGVVNGILGGWQVSSIIQARTGSALLITQPSGIDRSRPDVVDGVDTVLPDWKDTCISNGCNYLNTAAFARVPVSTVTNATLRPGTYITNMARGPGTLDVHATFAKSFQFRGESRLQLRADIFGLLNRKNYTDPVLPINNVDFGRITGATGNRIFQLATRLTF